MIETTDDGFLGGRLMIRQPARGPHRAGLDAVLLAACLDETTAGRVLDLGAGVGVAGLAIAARLEGVRVTLAEIDPDTAALARANLDLNATELGGRASVLVADVLARAPDREAAGLLGNAHDHVIMNPPFHMADRGRSSPNDDRARAHALVPSDLEAWVRAAAALVHPRGTLTVIFRADELPRLLSAIGTRFGSLSLLPVHPRTDEAAHRLILRGRPQGRAPLRMLPPLVLHEADGSWTTEADAILKGDAVRRKWWP
ncbi:tRNA1(Val) (adenine(37)-N6)-methyltransferase [Oryzibacter oryziterrae]|uniref:tRNA1(Val) (adenine(37)-N6)-methyltransferase n=1 Tax=Oryzibacter oryziterrae TaxID=2766474 RepID=UPI001F00ED14|nr:methyltransferase [Oryzibacter oryziterrae]